MKVPRPAYLRVLYSGIQHRLSRLEVWRRRQMSETGTTSIHHTVASAEVHKNGPVRSTLGQTYLHARETLYAPHRRWGEWSKSRHVCPLLKSVAGIHDRLTDGTNSEDGYGS